MAIKTRSRTSTPGSGFSFRKLFSQSWQSYLKDQGFVLFLSLFVGILFPWIVPPVVAWIGAFVPESSVQDHGNVLQFKLNAKQPTLTEVWDGAKHTHFTVVMKSKDSDGKTVGVVVYGGRKDGTHAIVKHIDCPADSWLRWQQAGSYTRLHLALADPIPGTVTKSPSLEVEGYIYLYR